MTVKKFLLILLTFTSLALTAQKKIATIDIKDVVAAYVDRPGDVYILHTNNKVSKFDSLGMSLGILDFEKTPTVFDPRDGARMFAYYNSTQQCSFFSAETKKDFQVEEHYAVDPIFATAAGDRQLWILDRSDLSLKRVDPVQSKVIAEALIDQKQFSQPPEFISIREYQSFLFLQEKNTGILIFNSLGKQIKTIPGSDISYFNFLGEELYYKKRSTLFFFDLFDGSTHEEATAAKSFYTLLTDARKYVVYADRIDVFEN